MKTTLLVLAVPFLVSVNDASGAAPQYTVTTLGPGVANSVNASGQAVGYNGLQAVLYSGGTVQSLGTLPGGSRSDATGINDSGQIGRVIQYQRRCLPRILYSGTSMQELGTLGGPDSYGLGINDSGQVVGYSYTGASNPSRAFLFGGGSMTNVGGIVGVAYAINNNGQVVGQTGDSAFVFSSGSLQKLGARRNGE